MKGTAIGLGAVSLALLGSLLPIPPATATTSSAEPQLISWSEARERPVLRKGDKNRWVKRLNRALEVKPSRKTFRRKTARAVRSFRKDNGMRPRAVVSARTWRLLGSRVPTGNKGKVKPLPPVAVPPPSADETGTWPELSQGMLSAWVEAVQRALSVEPATGFFGSITRAAVVDYQTEVGLPATGVVDQPTWNALGALVIPPGDDVTRSDSSRDSEAHRASIGVAAFASSWTANAVAQRESGGNCAIVSYNGTWRGKWQMDLSFWSTYGGLEFAPSPEIATCEQQDLVAYRGWVDRWWWPWRNQQFPS